MTVKVEQAEFFYSVPKFVQLKEVGNEVAIIGRSNSGKSSLINGLLMRRDLARTSKTPGRTRHAVSYNIALKKDDDKKQFVMVDLPGYGFASMSKSEAQMCEELIFTYLKKRKSLSLICLLIDIRRDPDQREKQILEIARKRDIDFFVILTKGDKISRAKRKPEIQAKAKKFSVPAEKIAVVSTLEKEMVEIFLEKFFSSIV